MKKSIFILLTLAIISFDLFAQAYVVEFRPWDSRNWGYLNINGDILIEPQHRKVYEFSEEGLALVYYSKRNHYDIINLYGEVLTIEPRNFIVKEAFGYGADGYHSGMIVYRNGKKWGALNAKGEIVIPVKYDFLSSFDDGYATAILKNNFFVLDNSGNEYPINVPDITKIQKFSEGLALYTTKDGLMGFVNTKGNIEIPAQFKKVGYFSSGLAWARTEEGTIGFINKTGEWAIEPKYLGVSDFDPVSQLARARIGEIWGYIDKNGVIYYVENVNKLYDYSEGLAMAVVNGLFGFLDKDQNWKIEPQFEAARKFQNGYAAAKLNGKWGIIDEDGSWVIEPQYSAIKDVSKVN